MAMLAASVSLLMWPIPRSSLSSITQLPYAHSLTLQKAQPEITSDLSLLSQNNYKGKAWTSCKSLNITFIPHLKEQNLCPILFFNSLIHWNETVPGNKMYLWMLNCGMDLWMSEYSLFPAFGRLFWVLTITSHKMCFGNSYASSQTKN